MSFQRGFKASANRIALVVRERMGLRPIDPIDPLAVCDFFDIDVIEIADLDCECSTFLGRDMSIFSAVTVPRGMRTAIAHNNAHHPHRQRSNICHELAHNFLGHEHAPPLTQVGERNFKSGIEGEANFLAGALLIPDKAAIHIALNGLGQQAQDLYSVSKPMLAYRLRVSGANTIAQRMMARRGNSRVVA